MRDTTAKSSFRQPREPIWAARPSTDMVSDIFDPERWEPIDRFDFSDITYHRADDVGAVRYRDRPARVRNAFRPETVDELSTALDHAKRLTDVGCVLLTRNGPSPKDDGWAFCSGGDQSMRGDSGVRIRRVAPRLGNDRAVREANRETIPTQKSGTKRHPRTSAASTFSRVQRQIRHLPKPRRRRRAGLGCRRRLQPPRRLRPPTIASAEHAKFLQPDPDVASHSTAASGSAYLARQIGQKKAREVLFFLGKTYDAQEAADMGMVNEAVPHEELEETALEWAKSRSTGSHRRRFACSSTHSTSTPDGMVGQQVFAGEATRLAYMTDDRTRAGGRDAFNEGARPDFDDVPWHC